MIASIKNSGSLAPTEFFKCLSDETRLAVLCLLHQQSPLCVCEIHWLLGLSQPKVSRHLSLLRQTKLVDTHKKSQWVYYSLGEAWESWMQEAFSALVAEIELTTAKRLDDLVDMPNRPCV
ncbi:MAG: ArsR/SmtB family transcription factor [Pontibacterium sp.]